MNPWHYEPAPDLEQPMIERLRHFPREPDMSVYGVRAMVALLLRGWLRFYHRFTIIGQENLPESGSFILVANHASHMDAVCLLAALPLRKLHRAFPAAASDYFFKSIPRIWFAAAVINALPFSRELHIRQSLSLCEQLLANPGNVLVLFPEGTRSSTGEISRFKPGVGILLAGRNIPVIPCHLAGAFRAWPKRRWVPFPIRITLRIGRPRSYADSPVGKDSACAIAAELQKAVEGMRCHHESD